MNIETKSVAGDISIYLKFGWKHTEDTHGRHGPHYRTRHVLARDKDNPNYRLLAALEQKYFALKGQLKTYEPMDPLISILLFLLLILPFVFYANVKLTQKQEVEAHNAKIKAQMDKVLKEAAPLL